MDDKLEDEYLGIKRWKIPELNDIYMAKLSGNEKEELIRRWRCVKDFEDGNAVGRIVLDNITVATFTEFRKISKKYFGNSDGGCLAGLTQIFTTLKIQQEIMGK